MPYGIHYIQLICRDLVKYEKKRKENNPNVNPNKSKSKF